MPNGFLSTKSVSQHFKRKPQQAAQAGTNASQDFVVPSTSAPALSSLTRFNTGFLFVAPRRSGNRYRRG
jgi:hypothetical protein